MENNKIERMMQLREDVKGIETIEFLTGYIIINEAATQVAVASGEQSPLINFQATICLIISTVFVIDKNRLYIDLNKVLMELSVCIHSYICQNT